MLGGASGVGALAGALLRELVAPKVAIVAEVKASVLAELQERVAEELDDQLKDESSRLGRLIAERIKTHELTCPVARASLGGDSPSRADSERRLTHVEHDVREARDLVMIINERLKLREPRRSDD